MNALILRECVFEPCAVKVARPVLKGGKPARAYLSKSMVEHWGLIENNV